MTLPKYDLILDNYLMTSSADGIYRETLADLFLAAGNFSALVQEDPDV